jgi:hypothetical protein
VKNHGQVILPDQLLSRRHGEQQSLRRLMIALLEEAIGTYQKNLFAGNRAGRELFREAESWLMTEGETSGLRFDDVCGVVDIDPDYVRRALRAWRTRAAAP